MSYGFGTSKSAVRAASARTILNGSPKALGKKIKLSMAGESPNSYARFDVPKRGTVSFSMTRPKRDGSFMQLELMLYDSKGREIWYSETGYSGGRAKTPTYHVNLERGSYYLKVTTDSYSSSSGSVFTTVKSSFKAKKRCITLPCDTKAKAARIALGKEYSGYVDGDFYAHSKMWGGSAYFKVRFPKKGKYRIYLGNFKAFSDYFAASYTPHGFFASSRDKNGGSLYNDALLVQDFKKAKSGVRYITVKAKKAGTCCFELVNTRVKQVPFTIKVKKVKGR